MRRLSARAQGGEGGSGTCNQDRALQLRRVLDADLDTPLNSISEVLARRELETAQISVIITWQLIGSTEGINLVHHKGPTHSTLQSSHTRHVQNCVSLSQGVHAGRHGG